MSADDPPNVRTLILRATGAPPRLEQGLETEGEYVRVCGRGRIYVRAGLSRMRARFVALHELAHHYYYETRQEGAGLEDRCDVLAATLAAPGPSVLRAFVAFGMSTRLVARALCTTQSVALLRMGECGLLPTALVEAHRSIRRGLAYQWPEHDVLVRALSSDVHGMRRVAITDEPGRVGLLAQNCSD